MYTEWVCGDGVGGQHEEDLGELYGGAREWSDPTQGQVGGGGEKGGV